MLTSAEIRKRYLEFFQERGHAVIPSASLVPENDPTVLFTTAGMHPLVPYLLGENHPQGKRLTSSQKCLRTGDIDEVGDNRHLTFFEMLGNWSLGDYFKNESIRWSFEFLTSKDKGLGLEPARLYVTIFPGNSAAARDDESIQIWQEVFKEAGIDASVDVPLTQGGRIFSDAGNWWGPAGQTGPCGPDTEIYYDLGEGAGEQTAPDGMPDLEGGRLIEIWNNVFMQYRKESDETFQPLEQHNVDTGMGLERIATVVQGVTSVFETDLFGKLFDALERETKLKRGEDDASLRITADHFKAAVFLICDGVLPGNKDRGYVLRRLIRRAALHSQEPDIHWVPAVVERIVEIYHEAYPEVLKKKAEVIHALSEEISKFQRTIEKGKTEIAKKAHITGKDAFDLYQSYGFPLELTREYAKAQGITIDEAEFEAEFKKHQDLSRTASAGQFSSGLADHSEQTVKYHTATHLLHQALRDVLGTHVQQKGSNITPERLRFDFSNPEKLTPEQVRQVEAIVNDKIKADLPVTRHEMSPQQAAEQGYIGLFGHKYGEVVSTYDMGGYSKEICTGPHVEHTGTLGTFKIQKEEAVSAGVRRIKAVLE